jgi:hypothetical protein
MSQKIYHIYFLLITSKNHFSNFSFWLMICSSEDYSLKVLNGYVSFLTSNLEDSVEDMSVFMEVKTSSALKKNHGHIVPGRGRPPPGGGPGRRWRVWC